MAATVALPRNLTTTTLVLLSHPSPLPPSFQPYFHSAPPLLVTTATGEGQKTQAAEKCVDEELSQLKNIKFVLRREADLLSGASQMCPWSFKVM